MCCSSDQRCGACDVSVGHFSAMLDFSDEEIPQSEVPGDLLPPTAPGSTSVIGQSSRGSQPEPVAKEVPDVPTSADPTAEEIVDLTKDAGKKDKKRKSSEVETGRSDHSKKHRSKRRAMLDVDQNIDDIASWDDSRVADMAKKASVLAMYVTAEASRRVSAASSEAVKADNDKLRLLVDQQKKSIAKLESQLEAQVTAVQTLQDKYKASELARLQAIESSEKSQSRVDELEDKVAVMQTDLDNHRAEVNRLEGEVAHFEGERKSEEFLADLQVLMRKAIRGGFVLAVERLTKAGIDSSELEKDRLYDPKAVDEYDRLLEIFRNRERLARPKKTPNPDSSSAPKDQA